MPLITIPTRSHPQPLAGRRAATAFASVASVCCSVGPRRASVDRPTARGPGSSLAVCFGSQTSSQILPPSRHIEFLVALCGHTISHPFPRQLTWPFVLSTRKSIRTQNYGYGISFDRDHSRCPSSMISFAVTLSTCSPSRPATKLFTELQNEHEEAKTNVTGDNCPIHTHPGGNREGRSRSWSRGDNSTCTTITITFALAAAVVVSVIILQVGWTGGKASPSSIVAVVFGLIPMRSPKQPAKRPICGHLAGSPINLHSHLSLLLSFLAN